MATLSFEILNCRVKQRNCRAKCKLPSWSNCIAPWSTCLSFTQFYGRIFFFNQPCTPTYIILLLIVNVVDPPSFPLHPPSLPPPSQYPLPPPFPPNFLSPPPHQQINIKTFTILEGEGELLELDEEGGGGLGRGSGIERGLSEMASILLGRGGGGVA